MGVELERIEREAKERRSNKYAGKISLDPAWQDAEAAVDELVVIARGLWEVAPAWQILQDERDEARALADQLATVLDSGGCYCDTSSHGECDWCMEEKKPALNAYERRTYI